MAEGPSGGKRTLGERRLVNVARRKRLFGGEFLFDAGPVVVTL